MQTKKELIIKAGVKLFGKFGPRKTSIDEIVKEAKIAKGTFYLYFKNKEELYKNIIKMFFKEGQKKIIKGIGKNKDIKEKVYTKLVISLKLFEKNDIIKNLVYGNIDYELGKISKEYMEKTHLSLLKGLLNDDNLDYKFVSNIFRFYINILNMKSCFKTNIEFEKFSEKLARVLVDGLFFEKND
ncbi:MAG: TetR/AcrR family transcriptional regulator [Candidatus Gracilibacteria bacterium]